MNSEISSVTQDVRWLGKPAVEQFEQQIYELSPRVMMEWDSFISSITWSNPASVQLATIFIGFLPAVDAVPYPPKSDIWQRSSLNVNILN